MTVLVLAFCFLCIHTCEVLCLRKTRDYTVVSAQDIPSYELDILFDFYVATSGQQWAWHNESFGMHWNFTHNPQPCSDNWQGINCTSVDASELHHIEGIELVNYDLSGTIPTSMGNLTALRYLVLNLNRLINTIPSSIGNLSELTVLKLNLNHLNGTLPASMLNLQQLEYINVGNNDLHGTLPEFLCYMPALYVYYLYGNMFTGAIPECIVDLQQLQFFDVGNNSLTGTLPAVLGQIPGLVALNVFVNQLTGTIPHSISNLAELRYLLVGSNAFEGTLPQEWSALTKLRQLGVQDNLFNGTIPAFFSDYAHLQILNMHNNLLTGTFPSALAQLSELQELIVYVNELTGTLPSELGALTKLRYLDLGGNRFHGTIPDSYGQLTMLRYLYLDINQLTGPIPASLGELRDLRYLFLRENALSHTIPSSLGNLSKLQEVVLYINDFTGAVPLSWCNFHVLAYLDIGNNRFHGTVPEFLGNLSRLQYLFINTNHLSGTVPSNLGTLSHLRELLMQDNSLSGRVPTDLSHLHNLSVLSMEYNHLSGTLDSAFNASTQGYLTTIKVNNNELTGTLPDEIFGLHSLNVLVAGSNCFKGSLPLSICNTSHLLTLSLDGLSSAEACRNTLLPGLSSSYMNRDVFQSTLLPCLLQMPFLNTLHLSGMDLSGSIPSGFDISPTLIDLSLSHNRLTGPIPKIYQQKLWLFLDLSYNRLSGTLRSDFASGTYELQDDFVIGLNVTGGQNVDYSLFLENNRLSGDIPESIQNLKNLSVLGSNMFSCDLQHSDLPRKDPENDKYQCGSVSFDLPYYVWMAGVGVCMLAGLAAWQYREHIEPYLQVNRFAATLFMWLNAAAGNLPHREVSDRLPTLAIVSRICFLLCRTALWCFLYILVVLLPVFSIVSVYSGTLTHQYGYTVSAAFLTGELPAGLEFVLLPGLLVLFVAVFVRQLEDLGDEELTVRTISKLSRNTSEESAIVHSSATAWLRNASVYLLFALINTTVVVGANVAYVYVVIYKSADLLTFAQILLAVFKLIWNGFGSVYLVRWSAKNISMDARQVQALETRFVVLQIFIALQNNIAIPCIVVAVVSPSCFYNVFAPPPTVTTPFTYVLCTSFERGQCTDFNRVRSSSIYQPSFTYNYQCSSSIITYYAPAFVTMCIIATFAVPLMEFLGQWLISRAPPSSLLYKTLDYYLPSILKPIDATRSAKPGKRYFRINRLLVSLTNYLGLLLTFGAVFPPLGAALVVTLIAVVYFSKIKVGHFMCRAAELGQPSYINRVEEECEKAGTVEVLRRTAWLLVSYSCLFYTLFIFDTLGDSVSLKGAYWVLIVMPLVPVVIFCVYTASARIHTSSPLAPVGDAGIEMDASVKRDAASSQAETFNVMQNVDL